MPIRLINVRSFYTFNLIKPLPSICPVKQSLKESGTVPSKQPQTYEIQAGNRVIVLSNIKEIRTVRIWYLNKYGNFT